MQADRFHLFTVNANGINHRLATVRGHAPFPPSKERRQPTTYGCHLHRPLVMLLHGWPEGWYCWRHQLIAIADAGYPVCAPDMRGYGGTDAPDNVLDYAIGTLCQDVLQISQALGFTELILVGHDMGAQLAWIVALLHPRQVIAVCGMSVPYLGHTPREEPYMARLQRRFGKSIPQAPYFATREEQEVAEFHYMIHHNLPHVSEEYDRNAREALFRIYCYRPGVKCDTNTPEVTDKRMFPPAVRRSGNAVLDARCAPGFWFRLPRPKQFPSWLSKDDFEYFLQQYQIVGFGGGLKWYQALDTNWSRTIHLRGKKIKQPALFLCGGDDLLVLKNHGGADHVMRDIHNHCTKLTDAVLIPGAGHWVQQECASQVNQYLLRFIDSVLLGSASKSRL